ncbi:hypothetical protein FP2506_16014 [Fulvimarina pelagi HTCC2506]|uniref:Uncharacterized protein n=1 Tax=Fulvimarina pelagi HTCC2506 TaxID=314231 RepID=Q0G377_9HYPH|nr:hypothetical protein FP2506_16014 [Fulvimarina pelagi HTCC2506]
MKVVVPCEIDNGSVVDNLAALGLADHRRLHPVVEDLARRADQGFESGAAVFCKIPLRRFNRPKQQNQTGVSSSWRKGFSSGCR